MFVMNETAITMQTEHDPRAKSETKATEPETFDKKLY